MTPELLEAMEVARLYDAGDGAVGSHDHERVSAAFRLLAREFIRMADAGELVRVRRLELVYFGYGRWKIPTLSGEWELHHYGRDDDTDAWILDFMDGRTEEHDTKESAIESANNENRARLAAALEPLTAKGDA